METTNPYAVVTVGTSGIVLTRLFLRDMVSRGKRKNSKSFFCGQQNPWTAAIWISRTKAFVQSFTEATRNEVKQSGYDHCFIAWCRIPR